MELHKRFKRDYYKACATHYQLSLNLMNGCESPQVETTLYCWLVRSLIYLTHSQPDISFEVSVVSHFMEDPREIHWKDEKHIMFNMKGASHFGFKYNRRTYTLVNYTNSNLVGDGDDQKSISSFVFGFNG